MTDQIVAPDQALVPGGPGESVVAQPRVFGERVWPRPQPVIVLDGGHSRLTRDYLACLDCHRQAVPVRGRWLVVRPAPGVKEQADVALDLLCALGKNPDILRQERARAWPLAQAWLRAAGVSDVFVDQAHALPVERITELLDLTIDLNACLWLIWGGPQVVTPAAEAIGRAGFQDRLISPDDLRQVLPLPGLPVPVASAPVWPWLPAVDFPTFRAACRRRLPGHDFASLDALYRDAFERVGAWMTAIAGDPTWMLQRVALPGGLQNGAGGRWPLLEDVREDLTGWLRDEQLGPAGDPGEALVVLRATPASLLRHAVWLRWQPAGLGRDPAGRLPGTLSPSVAPRCMRWPGPSRPRRPRCRCT